MGTLRIIAGQHKGRRLSVPSGLRVRPTAERVRESLFDILGAAVEGAAVLDPFAGSGAMGFESLSRGAREVTFFEADRTVLRCLRHNASMLGVRDRCRILAGRAERLLRSPNIGGPFDLVLADPPYGDPVGSLLAALEGCDRLATGAQVVLEREAGVGPIPAPGGELKLVRSVRYGRTCLNFYLL